MGAIVEKYIEQDYTSIIEKYIFEPLKIKANYKSYYTGDGYAEGHLNKVILRNDEYRPLGKNEHVKWTYEEPSGELYLNIVDSSKYLQEYLKASKNDGLIMTKSIYKNQTRAFLEKYGLGWTNTDNKKISHGGAWFETGTQYSIYPKKSLGIVININCYCSLLKIINNKFEEIFINV